MSECVSSNKTILTATSVRRSRGESFLGEHVRSHWTHVWLTKLFRTLCCDPDPTQRKKNEQQVSTPSGAAGLSQQAVPVNEIHIKKDMQPIVFSKFYSTCVLRLHYRLFGRYKNYGVVCKSHAWRQHLSDEVQLTGLLLDIANKNEMKHTPPPPKNKKTQNNYINKK